MDGPVGDQTYEGDGEKGIISLAVAMRWRSFFLQHKQTDSNASGYERREVRVNEQRFMLAW